jgi:molybdate transport system substrate-binding protein
MKTGFRAATIAAAVLLLHGAAQAAEIKVIASNGVTEIMNVLGPQYERATGNKLVIHYDVANVLKTAIEGGEAFDAAILTGPVTDALIQEGKLAAASRIDIAKSAVGLAYRAGSPKPDITTSDAFKQTLLNAKSVAYTTQGTSGQYFVSLTDRLGIADAVKAKSVVIQGGRVAELVAKGDAEFAVQQLSELLPVPGVQVLPLPPELQKYTVFTGAAGTGAKHPKAAAALIKLLAAPRNNPVIKAKGMEPG